MSFETIKCVCFIYFAVSLPCTCKYSVSASVVRSSPSNFRPRTWPQVPSSFANQGWQTLLRHASVSLPQPQLRLSCCGVEAGLLGGHAASAEDVCVACRCSRCLPQHQPPRSVPAASANGSLSSSGGSACAEDSHGERQRLHRGPDSSKGPPPAPSYIFFLQEWYMHAMQTAAGAEHDGAARKALAAARLATAAENGDAAAAARLDRLVKSEVMVVGEPEPSGGRPQVRHCSNAESYACLSPSTCRCYVSEWSGSNCPITHSARMQGLCGCRFH